MKSVEDSYALTENPEESPFSSHQMSTILSNEWHHPLQMIHHEVGSCHPWWNPGNLRARLVICAKHVSKDFTIPQSMARSIDNRALGALCVWVGGRCRDTRAESQVWTHFPAVIEFICGTWRTTNYNKSLLVHPGYVHGIALIYAHLLHQCTVRLKNKKISGATCLAWWSTPQLQIPKAQVVWLFFTTSRAALATKKPQCPGDRQDLIQRPVRRQSAHSLGTTRTRTPHWKMD